MSTSPVLDPEEFFQQNGYYPTTVAPARPPKLKSLHHSTTNQRGALGLPTGLALRGWKAPLHWLVPPPFEKPGQVLELVGVEAFAELSKSYWEAVRERRLGRREDAYERWVVRACLKTFKAHVLGFRRQDVGKRGGIFSIASDEMVMPEDLLKKDRLGNEESRFMSDLQRHLRAYGVPENRWASCERLLRARLTKAWGVQC